MGESVIWLFVIGLSIVMQALSFLSAAKVPGTLFILGRLLQAAFAYALTYILFPLFAPHLSQAASTFSASPPSFYSNLSSATALCLMTNLGYLAVSILTGLYFRFRRRA